MSTIDKEPLNQTAEGADSVLEGRRVSVVVESDSDEDASPAARDALTSRHVQAYSVGHFNNDLCASMWFIYLTWYVANIV
jgi:hypothetical protein